MEKEIWTKSKTDTLGLKTFFDKNLKNYNWKNRLDVVVLSSTKLDIIKKDKFLNYSKVHEITLTKVTN